MTHIHVTITQTVPACVEVARTSCALQSLNDKAAKPLSGKRSVR